MKHSLVACLICLMTAGQTRADEPFRLHRYSALQALTVERSDWVFVGNSITNMHEWWEALGGKARVKNRGCSGAVTSEILAHVDEYVSGQPERVYLGIGVNDLLQGVEPRQIAANIDRIVERVQQLSPRSRLVVSSIHPTARKDVWPVNALIRDVCLKRGVTFVDTQEALAPVAQQDRRFTFDGLHLTALGYKRWAELLPGVRSVYRKATEAELERNVADIAAGSGQGGTSFGMRMTYFRQLPVGRKDILIIGDEMVHGGEWHELLGNPHVKNRGTGWHHTYGLSLDVTLASLPYILHDGARPRHILLYCGVPEVTGQADMTATQRKYRAIVDYIAQHCPQTRLTLMALNPTVDAGLNSGRVQPFNVWLKELAEECGIRFLDTYSPLLDASGRLAQRYAERGDNYLTAEGYHKVAELLRPAL